MQEDYNQLLNFKVSKLNTFALFCLNDLSSRGKRGKNIGREDYSINEAYSLIFENDEGVRLGNYINQVTGINNKIQSIHIVNYPEGGKSFPHRDTNTSNTAIFLLENCDEGGNLEIYDSGKWNTVEMNTPGDWVYFDGSKYQHRVTEVKKGTRKVLVVWFEKNKDFI